MFLIIRFSGVFMLKKWFIPNYQNVESASVRNRYGTVASFFGIFTNILLGVMETHYWVSF